jgi:hypothetical protein
MRRRARRGDKAREPALAWPHRVSASIAASAIIFTAIPFFCACRQPDVGIVLQSKHTDSRPLRASDSTVKKEVRCDETV